MKKFFFVEEKIINFVLMGLALLCYVVLFVGVFGKVEVLTTDNFVEKTSEGFFFCSSFII